MPNVTYDGKDAPWFRTAACTIAVCIVISYIVKTIRWIVSFFLKRKEKEKEPAEKGEDGDGGDGGERRKKGEKVDQGPPGRCLCCAARRYRDFFGLPLFPSASSWLCPSASYWLSPSLSSLPQIIWTRLSAEPPAPRFSSFSKKKKAAAAAAAAATTEPQPQPQPKER
ncbi:hypothetical protein PG985_009282 [Apiospora marii]|uniref:Copper transporter n=1 Tax=Apiospora marii TaxID=335849 RepID=A0ABR1RA70_9PEZI